MTKRKDKEKQRAIKMRLSGASYSEIMRKINVSKGSLSNWLQAYPLSEKRTRELRDNNPRRIEKFRKTMRAKKEAKQEIEYKRAKKDIGKLSKRDIFIAGLFLYWGEGLKSGDSITALSNTDIEMIEFFIKWLNNIGVKKGDLKIRLHLYSDMNVSREEKWWSKKLNIPISQFRKSYVKKSRKCDITWKNPSQHGTCDVIYGSRKINDYVLMSLKCLKDIHIRL